MDIRSYSKLLWRRKWLIVGTFVVTILVVALGTYSLTPKYRATVTLRALTAARGSVDWIDYDIAYTDRLMNTYAQTATSSRVLEQAKQRLDASSLPAISAQVIPNTELMTIVAEGASPTKVAEAANILATILVSQSVEIYASSDTSASQLLAEELVPAEAELTQAQNAYAAAVAESPQDSGQISALARMVDLKQERYTSLLNQYEQAQVTERMRGSVLSIAEMAATPTAPSSPNLKMNLLLGAVLGLAGGLGLAILFEKLDDRLHTEQEIEKVADLRVLTVIANDPHAPIKSHSQDGVNSSDMYHRLRASIDAAAKDHPKLLLITSAQPGEGKSMLATNLAIAMGQAGRRVMIVDANLHRPSLHKILNLHNETGLTTVLEGEATLKEATQVAFYPRVWALTSGPLHTTPIEMFSSPRMAGLLESLETQFDIVLLDGPSVLGVADSAVLATMVDGIILVVSVLHARRDVIESACRQLVRMNARLLGMVVNRVPQTGDEHFRQYYHRASAARIVEGNAAVRPRVPVDKRTPASSTVSFGGTDPSAALTHATDEKNHEPRK